MISKKGFASILIIAVLMISSAIVFPARFAPVDGSSSPIVDSEQNILEYQFSGGITTSSTSDFYLPLTFTSAQLQVSWSDNGNSGSPTLTVYINGNNVYGSSISGNSSTNVNVATSSLNAWKDLGNGNYQENAVYATLSGYTGSWAVCFYFLVPYSLPSTQHCIPAQEYWANSYTMPETNKIVYFPTALPDGLVYQQSGGDTIYINAQAPNSNAAILHLSIFLNGANEPLCSWQVGGQAGKVYTEQYDLSEYLPGLPNIPIGIEVSNPSGNDPSGNWVVGGYITSVDRPCVAPDTSECWNASNFVNIVCINSGSLYLDNYFAGTYAAEVETTGAGYDQPSFYTAISACPNPVPVGVTSSVFEITALSTQLSYESPNNPGWTGTSYVGASGGNYIYAPPISENLGVDLLTAASLAAGVIGAFGVPDFAAGGLLLGAAGFLATFAPSPPSNGVTLGTQGTNQGTICQTYDNNFGSGDAFSMLMKDSANLPNTRGLYTFQFSAYIIFYNGPLNPNPTSLTVYNSFTYYVGEPPTSLSVDCSSSTLYSIALAAKQSFLLSPGNLGLTYPISTLNIYLDSDNYNVFQGVSLRQYDVGLVDTAPTDAEWNMSGLQGMQLWAIGCSETPFDVSGLLYAVTRSTLTTNEDAAAAVFIAYLMKTGTTQDGKSNFVQDAGYFPLSRADMAGDQPVDSNSQIITPGENQTYTIPNGVVDGDDFFYFVDAYIGYYANGIYNPYADIYAEGTINGQSFFGFVAAYISWYATYNPTSSVIQTPAESDGYNGSLGASPSSVLSAVEQGTTDSVWSVGPSPNPINSTVQVDVRIDNASGIWGWTIPSVTWNASVLQLTRVVEGGFLEDNTGGDTATMVGNSPSLFNNVNGTIDGGLSEAIEGNDLSTDASGVLATLYFNVTGSGVADVNLSGATLYANSTDTVGTAVTTNNATVTVTTPEFITASADGHSSISPSGTVMIGSGANQEFTIAANTGYSIANVVVDGQSQGPISSYTFYGVNTNYTISVTSTIDSYPITATSDSDSSISPSGTSYVDYGASQTYIITAASGYQIAHVYVDGVDQGAITSYTFRDVTASHTISVVSMPAQYIFSDSFQSGNFDQWTCAYGGPSSAAPQISTAQAYIGTYSAYFPAQTSGEQACLEKDFLPQTTLDVRLYIYLPALSSNMAQILWIDAANGDFVQVQLVNNQFLVTYYNNDGGWEGSYYSSTVSLTANTWFSLELALTPSSFKLYYNGASIASGSFFGETTGSFVDTLIGDWYTGWQPSPAFYIDDVVISTSYIGP